MMAKSSTKSKAPAKKAAPKAAQHAPAPARKSEAATAHKNETPARETAKAAARDQDEALTKRGPDAAAENADKRSEDLGMDTVHQRVLSNEEVAENAARERGAPAAGLDRDESPKVTGFRLVPDDRVVMVDDEVILVTPNPIEGQTENKAIVTKVNPNSTINVKVEIGGPTGTLRQFSSVRNEITQDRSPWWRWPEES
jgi:hypothetical protein